MHKSVPFSHIGGLLEELGFAAAAVSGPHHVFTHAPTQTSIILPPASGGRIQPIYVATVARTLDERGILPRDEFNRRLNMKAAKTGGAKIVKKKPVNHVRSGTHSRLKLGTHT